ncbi:MAG: type II toxin-antitoxin system VapC family toxin [Methanobrevibacter sp. CfCl-M3]
MRIYLDVCSYNRPFDEKNQINVEIESIAKLHIQKLIREGKYDLVWSYILDFENKCNPYDERRESIQQWENIAKYYCVPSDEIRERAKQLNKLKIKENDALHISCAIDSKCSYFITTDYKLIRKPIDEIKIINPTDFINKIYEKV